MPKGQRPREFFKELSSDVRNWLYPILLQIMANEGRRVYIKVSRANHESDAVDHESVQVIVISSLAPRYNELAAMLIASLKERVRELCLELERDLRRQLKHAKPNDPAWAADVERRWRAKLRKLGFEAVQFVYRFSGDQGENGASFTTEYISIKTFLEHEMRVQEASTYRATELVTALLSERNGHI